MRKFDIGDTVRVVYIEKVDEEIIHVGSTYKIIGLDIDEADESYMYDLDLGEEYFGSWIVYEWQIELFDEYSKDLELGEMQVDDDKPFRDALSEIAKRIRGYEQKIEQLKAVGEAIKKLREE